MLVLSPAPHSPPTAPVASAADAWPRHPCPRFEISPHSVNSGLTKEVAVKTGLFISEARKLPSENRRHFHSRSPLSVLDPSRENSEICKVLLHKSSAAGRVQRKQKLPGRVFSVPSFVNFGRTVHCTEVCRSNTISKELLLSSNLGPSGFSFSAPSTSQGPDSLAPASPA